MPEKKSVTVTIYKNEYTLKGEADSQHIIDLAKYVDGRMTEMGSKSSAPADKIAILVSMNIADELHRLEKANQENLKLIENLEKNLEEIKNSADNAVKNASVLNEQADNLRMQLSQEKEKIQSAIELKGHAEHQAESYKKQAEGHAAELERLKAGLSNSQATAHDLTNNLEEYKKRAQSSESQHAELKNRYESLEAEMLSVKESAQQAAPAVSAEAGVSEDQLKSLVKKIETVLE